MHDDMAPSLRALPRTNQTEGKYGHEFIWAIGISQAAGYGTNYLLVMNRPLPFRLIASCFQFNWTQ